MKSLQLKSITVCSLAVMLVFNTQTFAQDSISTAVDLAPGVTNPVGKDTTKGANTQMLTAFDGNDIRIFPSPNPQSEIHISINRLNPNVLLLSSQTFPVTNSYQGAYWSTNGGTTWVGSDNLPNNAPGRGDPSTAFDAAGNGYISTMTYPVGNINAEPNGYAIQRTANNGATWQPQVSGSGIINGLDKEMIAADDIATSPFANNLYCAWTNLNSSSRVQFNRSTNQGVTFSTPIFLSAGAGQGTNVQTGVNGEVYVCWSDYAGNALHDISAKGLGFCRSTNGGVSFTSNQRALSYTGIRAYNSATDDDENPLFANIRVNDFPSMAVDKSTGRRQGRIYVAVPVKENGNGKAVIQISWSDNQGTTWSTPKTISIAFGRQNWFPWVSVDATNGNIYVIYYSLDAATGFATNTYVAISNDGGANFVNQRVSDIVHTTAPIPGYVGGYCGDYIGITSHAGKAYAAWYDNRTGQWQDYVSQVSNSDVTGNDYFCTSGTYRVTNIPANAAVRWSVSPAGIADPSCINCSRTILTARSIGTVTLTATITNACGATSLVISRNISVGFAPVKDSSVLIPNSCSGTYQTWAEYAVPVANAVSWAWTKSYVPPGGDVYIDNPSGSHTFVDVSGGSPSTIRLTYTDVCGNVGTDGATIYSSCHGFTATASSFDITPNPAVNSVSIKTTNQSSLKSNIKTPIYAIKITDGFGNQRKLLQYKSGITSTTISIADLQSGVYLVSVFNGSTWSSKSLIVQK